MTRFLLVACAICAWPVDGALAQSARERSSSQIADSVAIARLAQTLVGDVATDSARAARAYEWVARNITYDVRGYLAGRLADGSAENVYRRRLAVCGGYVALYERLLRESGIEATPILGYAKGFTYRSGAPTREPNHSWLAVRIDGNWRLIDPTWGSGVVAGTKFEPRFTWDYFLVEPDELILSHFPEDGRWQLLPRAVRRADFERLPLVPRTLVNAGFDASMIRTTALAQRVRTFPLVGTYRDVRIIAAPLSGTLARKSTVTVDVVWPGVTEVALVSGGVWRQLVRDGDRFRGEAVAAETTVSVVGRGRGAKQFDTLLYYEVQ
jgi:transglutaminase-like putative cysteine protease